MTRLMMLTLLAVSPALVLAEDPPKPSGPSPEAVEFARKTADALLAAKVVIYKATYTPTGWVAKEVPTIEGTATVGEQSRHKVDAFMVKVKIRKADSEDVVELSAGSDGNEYFLVDSKAKICYKDLDLAVLGSQSRNLQRIVLRDFAAPEPLANVIKNGEIELRGDVKIGSEDCRELYMKHRDTGTAVWAVSKKDYLPRKVTRIIKNDQGEGKTELLISDLVVNPQFVKSPFELVCPEGFKKTDEFAP
jgi:hypothetical protein